MNCRSTETWYLSERAGCACGPYILLAHNREQQKVLTHSRHIPTGLFVQLHHPTIPLHHSVLILTCYIKIVALRANALHILANHIQLHQMLARNSVLTVMPAIKGMLSSVSKLCIAYVDLVSSLTSFKAEANSQHHLEVLIPATPQGSGPGWYLELHTL